MKVLPIHNMQGIRVFRNTWRRLAMACRPACVAAAFLAMAIAPACTKSETVADSGSGTEDPYMMPMTLSASAEMMNGTKALIEPDDFQTAGNQIKVFDKLTIDGNSETDLYINGRIAEYGTAVYSEDGSVVTGWNLRDDNGYRKYYWTRNGTHSFTAFTWEYSYVYSDASRSVCLDDGSDSPVMKWRGTRESDQNLQDNPDLSSFEDGLTFNPRHEYIVIKNFTLNHNSQFDLMYGHHTRNLDDPNEINPYRDVPLEMKHLFTAVQFNVINLIPDYTVAYGGFSLYNLHNKGSAIIRKTDSTGETSPDILLSDSHAEITRRLSGYENIGYGVANAVNVFKNYGKIGDDGCLLLWPQENSMFGETDGIYAQILLKKGTNEQTPTISLLTDSIRSWEPGRKYVYNIYIQDNRISFTVEIVDWIYDDIVIEG